MTQTPSGLNQAFAFQIAGCEAFGSRFSADVLRIIIEDVAAGGPFAALVEPWAGWDARALILAAAPLRLLGGLHYLALSGADPALAAEFPAARAVTDVPGLRKRLSGAAVEHAATLEVFTLARRRRPTRCDARSA